jgi:hypothetical protein
MNTELAHKIALLDALILFCDQQAQHMVDGRASMAAQGFSNVTDFDLAEAAYNLVGEQITKLRDGVFGLPNQGTTHD